MEHRKAFPLEVENERESSKIFVFHYETLTPNLRALFGAFKKRQNATYSKTRKLSERITAFCVLANPNS